jgi:hypothetical protein
MSEAQLPAGALEPTFFMEAMQAFNELSNFARMVDLGFMLGATLSTVFDLFQNRLSGDPRAEHAIAGLRPLATELQPYAASESSNELPYLQSLLVIRYVTIIETVVQDAVAYSLLNVSDVLNRPEVQRLKGTVADLLTATPTERVEFLVHTLSQEVKAPLQKGIGKFEVLLGAVGLSGGVDAEVRKALLELLNIRNVVVHSRGRVDSRFLENCPSSRHQLGEVLRITPNMSERYRTACVYYLAELIIRWTKRDHAGADTTAFQAVQKNALQKFRATTGAG